MEYSSVLSDSSEYPALPPLQNMPVRAITEKVNAIWESMIPEEAHNLWGYTDGWKPLYIALAGAGGFLILIILWNGLCGTLCKRNKRTFYPRYGPKRDEESSLWTRKQDYEPLSSEPEKTIDVLDRIQEVNNIKKPHVPRKDYNSFDN